MKLAIFLLMLSLSSLAANTKEIAKAFEGLYELDSGTGECARQTLDIKYYDDGNPHNCVDQEGPRLSLDAANGEVIRCIDSKEGHGAMDTFTCNFVWDAKTSTDRGNKIITLRKGRQCLIMPTKWSKIQTYTLQKNGVLSIKTEDRVQKTSTVCSYVKI